MFQFQKCGLCLSLINGSELCFRYRNGAHTPMTVAMFQLQTWGYVSDTEIGLAICVHVVLCLNGHIIIFHAAITILCICLK